jgi:predicted Ser/Thr protein kinase
MPDSTPGEAFHLAGDRLGKFVILNELGRGSMGVVYETYQEDLKRKVALKILPANIALNAKQVKRFRREAESMARLTHDNIVQIHEVGEIDGTHYFAMEMVDGQPLGEQLGRDRDSIREAARLVMDAALGLAHAHEHGVIHRDIKPGNLLVSREGRIVVTDFGLARLTDSASLTSTDAIVGTPKYMSPEQILPGTKPIDGRTDVYSLGATLYEITTGQPPFDEPSVQAFIRAILEQRPSSPRRHNRQVPHDLATIVMRCLEKNPEERYASAKDLAEDLRLFLAGERIHAKPKGALALGLETLRRHRLIASLSVVAVVALVLVLWLGGEAAKAARGRQISEELTRIQKLENLDTAVADVEALRDKFPNEQSIRDVRAVIYRRHAMHQLTDPEVNFEKVLEKLDEAGEQGTFWYLMMLLETQQFDEARAAAERLPAGDLRRLVEARLALVNADYERALVLAQEPRQTELPQHMIYVLLTRAEALLAQAQRKANAGAPEAEIAQLAKQAEGPLSRAQREFAPAIPERYLRTRIDLTLGRMKDLKGEEVNLADVILDSASAIREVFRNLTRLWANMTRSESAVAQEYVDRVLELNGFKEPPLDLERAAQALVVAAKDPRARIGANLLLAVTYLSRGNPKAAQDALDEAQDWVVDAGAPGIAAYVYWGVSLVNRSENEIALAIGWAKQAFEFALRADKFLDLEPLTRHFVLLGEEARKRDNPDEAQEVGKFLGEQLKPLERTGPWVSELLERAQRLAAGSAPAR